ncbi:MAG: hypothetical protein VKK62_11355 [Synechococcaceae cyanobacterium]|nr:hypothetical protein [Synechococcaceae cyanobacterium]
MARPRWHRPLPQAGHRIMVVWDRFVAIWAAINLLWVVFDLTYVPLRAFWLQRNLYPIPSVPLAVNLSVLPDVTPLVDPIKGIEPHRETEAYRRAFGQLDQAMATHRPQQPLTLRQRQLLARQVELTREMIDTNPFLGTGGSGTLEKIKNRLRVRAASGSARQASDQLLSPTWLVGRSWSQERQFWTQRILPLVATNYWRSTDENGRPTDHFWRYDLLLFQSVFILDIALRTLRLRRRLPGLSWNEALLRRWIDLPLVLPFWRVLRLLPVLERLQTSGLINLEPLRAVISRAVVALLAVELFEVLALQILDALQQLIRSGRWPRRLRALRSHQTVIQGNGTELLELVRIWAPLLLVQVAPRLAPELQGVLGHALQQSLKNSVVPPPLRRLQPLLQVEQGLSRQLASGMVDSLLDLGRTTGERLGRRDDQQLELLRRFIDRFWEELATALETGTALPRSQELICAVLEDLKATYVSQINRSSIESLIDELDQLISRQGLDQEATANGGTIAASEGLNPAAAPIPAAETR